MARLRSILTLAVMLLAVLAGPATAQQRGGLVSGHVYVDSNGDGRWTFDDVPIAGVTVRLTEPRADVRRTDRSGFFTFGPVPSGQATVVLGDGYLPIQPANGVARVTVEPSQSAFADFAVRGAAVTGRVDAAGEAPAGSVVSVDGEVAQLAVAGGDGRFTTGTVLPAGDVTLTARRPGFDASEARTVRLAAGETVDVGELSLTAGEPVDPGRTARTRLIGHRGVLGDGVRDGKVTFLRGNLKPVRNRPRMPRGTEQVEMPPGEGRIVARSGRVLRFYRVRGGERLGRKLRLRGLPTGPEHRIVMSWVTRNRLLVVAGHERAAQTVIAVVRPSSRRVALRRLAVPLSDASRAARRQLLLSGGDVLVLDKNGRVKHRIADVGGTDLQGRLVLSSVSDGTSLARVSRIGVRGGIVRRTHDVNTAGLPVRWIPDAAPGVPILAAPTAALYLDPETFGVTRLLPLATGDFVRGGGPGFVEGGNEVRRFGPAGERLWRLDRPSYYPMTFRRRTFLVDFDCRTGEYSTTIVGRDSGRVVATRPAAYELMAPSAGDLATVDNAQLDFGGVELGGGC